MYSDEKNKAAQDKAQGAYDPPIGRQDHYTPAPQPKTIGEAVETHARETAQFAALPAVLVAAAVDYVLGTNMTGVNDDINEKQREYNDAWDRAPRTPR